MPRPPRDLDLVGDFAFDVEATVARFAAVLAVALADEVCVDASSLRGAPMWLHTAFPGVRLALSAGLGAADREVTIDVGFNDPLVPEPADIAFAGTTGEVAVRAVRPETQLAWKLHGLAERGGSFRPKDLHDAHLIATRCRLDDAAVAAAIVAAFASRGYPRSSAHGVLAAAHWATKTARVRWDRAQPLDAAIAELRGRLDPVLAALPDWEVTS